MSNFILRPKLSRLQFFKNLFGRPNQQGIEEPNSNPRHFYSSSSSSSSSGPEDQKGSGSEPKGPKHGPGQCSFITYLIRSLADCGSLLGAGLVAGWKIQSTLQTNLHHKNRQRGLPTVKPFQLQAYGISTNPSIHLPLKGIVQAYANKKDEEKAKVSKTKQIEELINQHRDDLTNLASEYINECRNMIGVAILESGDASSHEGLKYLESATTSGKALFNLGVAYEVGQSTQPDLKLAFHYYERAAKLGHKFATYNLALFYMYGKGPVSIDLNRGVELLELAHKMGVEEASVYRDYIKSDKPCTGSVSSSESGVELDTEVEDNGTVTPPNSPVMWICPIPTVSATRITSQSALCY